MEQQLLTVESTKKLTADVTALVLSGDMKEITAPGQFVNIKVDGLYLRRPISICDYDHEHLLLIFRNVGDGTDALSKAVPGDVLDVLIPLGNGFYLDPVAEASHPVLLGGGIGLPPLYGLARALLARGVAPAVVCGFGSMAEAILVEEFRDLGLEVHVTTVDGSLGTRGMVTDVLSGMDCDYICACGPEPMLKAVWEHPADGQYSFEARMACGFGACMGCSCRTVTGYKRICTDGPVLRKEEILW